MWVWVTRQRRRPFSPKLQSSTVQILVYGTNQLVQMGTSELPRCIAGRSMQRQLYALLGGVGNKVMG